MDHEGFWRIIEQNRGDANAVQMGLATLPAAEIAAWHRMYYDLHNALHRGDLWDVADIIYNTLFESPSSDDNFHYFKAWLIGKGREAYETALRDPDDLGRFILPGDLDASCDNESLNYAAEHAWESLGKDPEQLARNSNEGEESAGERCDPEDWPKRFPRLVERFGPCCW